MARPHRKLFRHSRSHLNERVDSPDAESDRPGQDSYESDDFIVNDDSEEREYHSLYLSQIADPTLQLTDLKSSK